MPTGMTGGKVGKKEGYGKAEALLGYEGKGGEERWRER